MAIKNMAIDPVCVCLSASRTLSCPSRSRMSSVATPAPSRMSLKDSTGPSPPSFPMIGPQPIPSRTSMGREVLVTLAVAPVE